MRVVVLDIDGVLNNEVFPNAFFAILKRLEIVRSRAKELHKIVMRDEYGNFFCPTATNMLAYIIEQTGAKIVISSSWRHSGLQFMQDMWKERGLPGEVIDITPSFHRTNDHMPFKERAERGHEIKDWLTRHPEVESYVILDDDDDMLPEQEARFVRTNERYGITFDDAKKCIEILNEYL